MATIGWNESAPADADNAGTADDQLRSLKTAIRTGLEDAMYWQDGSSLASAGQMKPGKARAFFDVQSRVSGNTDGCLMITSDTSRLFAVPSGASLFLGSARVIENALLPVGESRWVQSTFTMENGTSGRTTFNPVYDNTPSVVISAQTASTTTVGIPYISLLSAGGIVVQVFRDNGVAFGGGTWIVHVTSSGTVTF